ncbi:hypothetical protein VZT92_002511 [Zoarces viviparus]|uniref:Uncharacterized protein n=1 Tax=Zoarces viviparus TaxID=48416 RepID=A0AAW1FYQ3_ZOAVI
MNSKKKCGEKKATGAAPRPKTCSVWPVHKAYEPNPGAASQGLPMSSTAELHREARSYILALHTLELRRSNSLRGPVGPVKHLQTRGHASSALHFCQTLSRHTRIKTAKGAEPEEPTPNNFEYSPSHPILRNTCC